MNHHRFFIEPSQIDEGRVTIRGPQARQICTVLRLQFGNEITVLDGSGCCHITRLSSTSPREVVGEITYTIQMDNELPVRLTLAQALAKGDKVEMVVQKATELGICDMIVFVCSRAIPIPLEDRIERKLARWRSIAREAAEQSGRGSIPTIEGAISFDDLLTRVPQYDVALIASETGTNMLLRQALETVKQGASVIYIVGPEGGYTDNEMEIAVKSGAVPVSLGKRILRTETAAVAGCAIIAHHVEC